MCLIFFPVFQFFLAGFDEGFQLFLVLFGSFQFLCDLSVICLHFSCLTADFFLFPLDSHITAPDFFCFFLQLLDVHPGCILPDGLFLEFLLQGIYGIPHFVSFTAVILHGLTDFVVPGRQFFHFLFQFFDLTAAAEKIAVVLKSSTCHGTTRA